MGDHLPRKCGIATFTSDLLSAVAAAHPQTQCFCVSVNDLKGGYDYPDVVRFEIEEQDLSSYVRAADFLNINNVLDSEGVMTWRGWGVNPGDRQSYLSLPETGRDTMLQYVPVQPRAYFVTLTHRF